MQQAFRDTENRLLKLEYEQDSILEQFRLVREEFAKVQTELQQKLVDTQNQLENSRKEIARLKQENERKLAETQNQLKKLENQIENLPKNSVPVGFIYVQLPHEKSPKEVWPSLTWTDVSSTYAGVFLRVEGGEAAAFGSIQEDNAPRVVRVETKYGSEIGQLPSLEWWNTLSLEKGTKSNWAYTGGNGGSNSIYIQFTTSSGEVRPRNMAIRVWKRTA